MTATETRPDTAVRQNPARDTWNVLTRELKPVVRDPFTLIFSLVQPLVFLGLFAPLLIGTSGEPPAETLTGERIHQWLGASRDRWGHGWDLFRIERQQILVRRLLETGFPFERVLADPALVSISDPEALKELALVRADWPFAILDDVRGVTIDGKDVLLLGRPPLVVRPVAGKAAASTPNAGPDRDPRHSSVAAISAAGCPRKVESIFLKRRRPDPGWLASTSL